MSATDLLLMGGQPTEFEVVQPEERHQSPGPPVSHYVRLPQEVQWEAISKQSGHE